MSGKTVPSIAGATDSILTRDSSSVRLGRRQSAWPRWLALLAAVASARAAAQSWWLAAPVQVPGGVVLSHTKAAEQGDADAQQNLSVMYARGEGVARDAAKSRYWARKARESRARGED